jgi:hypothetical protein
VGRLAVSTLLAAVATVATARARAEPTDTDRVLAQTLFEQGRQLMEAGRYPEACPKLAESQRLDPGGGTLLNLAICHEAEGRTATAWAELNEALGVAKRDNRADREQTARERIANLEGKLSTITVSVSAGARVPGLQVRIDGVAIGSAAWDTPTPVDPGLHEVSAQAPGKAPYKRALRVATNGDRQTVAVPPFLDSADRRASAAEAPRAPATRSTDVRRTAGLALGGVGLAAVGVGTFFGVRAASQKSDSDAHCSPACDQQGVDAWSAAKTSALVADLGIGIGVAAIAAATVLVLTAAKPSTAMKLDVQRSKVAFTLP